MTQLTLAEAQDQNLADLLDQGASGEEIVICGDGIKYHVRVTAVRVTRAGRRIPGLGRVTSEDAPSTSDERRFGSDTGKIWMSDDFDEPLDDFREYM